MLSVGLDSLWNVEWCVERWVRLFVECGVLSVGLDSLWNAGVVC